MSVASQIKSTCIHCTKCNKNCDFLSKYKIDLAQLADRPDLRYSCFMCDKCKAVCPLDLSGRGLVLEQRMADSAHTFKIKAIKTNYIYSNRSKKTSRSLLFTGCNYPTFLPKTTDKMIAIAKKHGVDYSVDCCQWPVRDEGIKPNYDWLNKLLKQKGTKEIITMCPNCYYIFKEHLDVKIISVYAFLKRVGEGKKIKETCHTFFPCSDRYKREVFVDIQHFAPDVSDTFTAINCCGAGGSAGRFEPDLVQKINVDMHDVAAPNVYTYCSTCAGTFERYKLGGVKNYLSEILGVHEKAATMLGFAKNALDFKIISRR